MAFSAYRLIFMVTSLTIRNRFSFNILMNFNEYRSIFNLVCNFFYPGSVFRRMSLDRKLTIFR